MKYFDESVLITVNNIDLRNKRKRESTDSARITMQIPRHPRQHDAEISEMLLKS